MPVSKIRKTAKRNRPMNSVRTTSNTLASNIANNIIGDRELVWNGLSELVDEIRDACTLSKSKAIEIINLEDAYGEGDLKCKELAANIRDIAEDVLSSLRLITASFSEKVGKVSNEDYGLFMSISGELAALHVDCGRFMNLWSAIQSIASPTGMERIEESKATLDKKPYAVGALND